MNQGQDAEDQARLDVLRSRQQGQSARGCLLALVLEGAALLAAGLWLLALLLELPRVKAAGFGAFVLFTLAAKAAGGWLLIMGNLPSQRRLRREHQQSLHTTEPTARNGAGARSGPDKRAF